MLVARTGTVIAIATAVLLLAGCGQTKPQALDVNRVVRVAKPPWQKVIDDWYRDGRIDHREKLNHAS